MLKFEVDSIRYHRRGVTLELREVGEPKSPAGGHEAHFRCSAPGAGGPNFSLTFDRADPQYSLATDARIGTVFELGLQPATAPVAP